AIAGTGQEAGPLSWLLLPHPEVAGPGRAGWRNGLRGEGGNDWRLRADRMAGGIWRVWCPDLDREPPGNRLQKGPRPANRDRGSADYTLQSGQELEASGRRIGGRWGRSPT